ncbi:MAG: methylmalonyl-CoA decarboxylase [Bacteroidales bacterium]|nr:methylmalonyl-CoA decarboxylase [Bacteroidales bacterium]
MCKKYIQTFIQKQIATITLNNDAHRNAFNLALLAELCEVFDEFKNENIRVVILRNNPEANVWCAGSNIHDLPDPGKDPLPKDNPLEKLMRKIEEFPHPVIAMLDGSVWGGGCDLAFSCDLLIGTNQTTFAITTAKMGVPYNAIGILNFLNRVPINVAKEMFYTAKPISAEKAYTLGILNHLVAAENIETFTYNLALDIAANSPLSISVTKQQLNLLSKARPLDEQSKELIEKLRYIAYTSEDMKEGKRAFMEKRKPTFKGK